MVEGEKNAITREMEKFSKGVWQKGSDISWNTTSEDKWEIWKEW